MIDLRVLVQKRLLAVEPNAFILQIRKILRLRPGHLLTKSDSKSLEDPRAEGSLLTFGSAPRVKQVRGCDSLGSYNRKWSGLW